ncbi:ubiquitin-conjugating enzyme [Nitzschia inconspicua]|uniref:Ubiquitin-conjugating enzyme n=1 Tax=Nitzschia inconspicua TaxID=303405 RepID=A0A9K3LPV4_9STRA|nr:ubiquitin-conjugating enzyme [Nitzschia inconspicua]
MAPALATKRLRKEFIQLQNEPPPGIIAEPKESNILTWYYAVRGPVDTPYDGGIYVGKLIFPSEYPMMGPSIMMGTPSGRFQINTKICMSMSGDFHPESWNPLWSVATIIQGIQSFMASDELTTGGMKASDSERKKLAKLSHDYNRKMFPNLFNGDIEEAMKKADEISQKVEAERGQQAAAENDGVSRVAARRARRVAARKAQAGEKQHANEEHDSNEDDDDGDQESASKSASEALTPEEIEKRRKKNAKKRAKQKAKKAASAAADGITE